MRWGERSTPWFEGDLSDITFRVDGKALAMTLSPREYVRGKDAHSVIWIGRDCAVVSRWDNDDWAGNPKGASRPSITIKKVERGFEFHIS